MPDNATVTAQPPSLNEDQTAALEGIVAFLADPDEQFYLLKGYAGTGKTFLIQRLPAAAKGRFVYTAPTNKATKCLRDTLTTKDYKPECRTIYSLLGLKMEASGGVKELAAPEDPIDLTQYKAVIVDEGSMVNEQLRRYIHDAADQFGVKFIFMGDPAQLPPVGELRSPIWRIKTGVELTKVMRHDNQILDLATRIRQVVDHPAPQVKLDAANADGEGIWRMPQREFEAEMRRLALTGAFQDGNGAKAIAWRNVTVDSYNRLIRGAIFDNPTQPWLADDRVIFTSPARSLDDEPMASTDDEGRVMRAEVADHPIMAGFKCWRLSITLDDNRPVVAWALHADSMAAFARRKDELAAEAKVNKRMWKAFWEFVETFHNLRHAYAITAHRSQGSTYETVFVDWRDILINRNKAEAYRCLYVGCTRPKKRLVLN